MPVPWKRRSFIAAMGSTASAVFLDPRLGSLPTLPPEVRPAIKVIGVGGAGCSVLDYLTVLGVDSTSFVAVDSDLDRLDRSMVATRIQIGRRLLNGLGAAAHWENGYRAAVEDLATLSHQLDGARRVILTCGLGGGIGGGATPVIAHAARRVCGAEVWAVSAQPVRAEGVKCRSNADHALDTLRWAADHLATVSFPESLAHWLPYDIACFERAADMAEHVLRVMSPWRELLGALSQHVTPSR